MDELPPLLHLPPRVRYRIYDFVGLARATTPHLNAHPEQFDLHGRSVDTSVPPPSTFHGLLLSCRAIYSEAAPLVYSGNLFVVRYDPSDPEPLQPLHALTATSLSSLTSLTIILNQASCHEHRGHAGGETAALRAATPAGVAWAIASPFMATRINPLC